MENYAKHMARRPIANTVAALMARRLRRSACSRYLCRASANLCTNLYCCLIVLRSVERRGGIQSTILTSQTSPHWKFCPVVGVPSLPFQTLLRFCVICSVVIVLLDFLDGKLCKTHGSASNRKYRRGSDGSPSATKCLFQVFVPCLCKFMHQLVLLLDCFKIGRASWRNTINHLDFPNFSSLEILPRRRRTFTSIPNSSAFLCDLLCRHCSS